VELNPTDVLLFVGGMLFWTLVAGIPVVFISRKMRQSGGVATAMGQNAEVLLAAFAVRVGGFHYPARKDFWGTRYLPGVRYRCHDVDVDLTYSFDQGASKAERVMMPFLRLYPPPGFVWRGSPESAIKQALGEIGRMPRKLGRYAGVLAVYLEPTEWRRGGNFVAPLVEGIVDVDTLVQMVDISCRAARTAVAR
jgi:hypothetical protein